MLSQLLVGVFMWQTLWPTCLQEQREECAHLLGANVYQCLLDRAGNHWEMNFIECNILLLAWCFNVFAPLMVWIHSGCFPFSFCDVILKKSIIGLVFALPWRIWLVDNTVGADACCFCLMVFTQCLTLLLSGTVIKWSALDLSNKAFESLSSI